MPLGPMSYAKGLSWLRYFLGFPWLQEPPEIPQTNYTLHSLKTTLLSFANQLPHISDTDRRRQGNHRGGPGASMELYSRDDVEGALRLQLQVRLAVLDGKRFTTPQHRGGQLPLKAIPVHVEFFSKEMGSKPWGFFNFDLACVGQLPALPEDPCTGLHPSWEFVNACEAEASAASAASSSQESQLADPACFPDSTPARKVRRTTRALLAHLLRSLS